MDKIMEWIMENWQKICDFIAQAFKVISENIDV